MVTKKDKEKEIDEKTLKRIGDLEEQLKKALEEVEMWKNKYYMMYADMENARKQNEKTLSESLKYRVAGFVENLFPALDSFQIALGMKTDDETLKRFLVGFEHIHRQIQSALEAEGLIDVTPEVGVPFDYKTMHALDTEESDIKENHVVRIMARGYRLKDRLVRPTMVILSKKKAPIPEPVKEEPIMAEPNSTTEFDA